LLSLSPHCFRDRTFRRILQPAGNNPFNVKGLEWETTSPPPTFNFERTPIVTDATHSYAPHTEVRVA